MSRIIQPVGKLKMTNVATVKYEHSGKKFEIACYKNKIVNWRNKVETDIDEVLQIPHVFTNVSKGIVAKKEDLLAVFKTSDEVEVSKIILEKGTEQVSEKEREVAISNMTTDIATMISEMCYNPDTDTAYTAAMIQRAMKDAHISVNLNKSTKKQSLDLIPVLRKVMKLERKQMKLSVNIENKHKNKLVELLNAEFITIVEEKVAGNRTHVTIIVDTKQYKVLETDCHKLRATIDIVEHKYVPPASEEAHPPATTPSEVLSEEPTPQVTSKPNGVSLAELQDLKFKCLTCLAAFTNLQEQRSHCKGDWHRFNLKRCNKNLHPMTEAEFDFLDDKEKSEFLNKDSVAT